MRAEKRNRKEYFNLTEQDRTEMEWEERKKIEENEIVESVYMKFEEKLKKQK